MSGGKTMNMKRLLVVCLLAVGWVGAESALVTRLTRMQILYDRAKSCRKISEDTVINYYTMAACVRVTLIDDSSELLYRVGYSYEYDGRRYHLKAFNVSEPFHQDCWRMDAWMVYAYGSNEVQVSFDAYFPSLGRNTPLGVPVVSYLTGTDRAPWKSISELWSWLGIPKRRLRFNLR